MFWCEGPAVWVRDLQSRNGTFVDDRRVDGAARVEDGAVVRLGPSATLRVRIEEHVESGGVPRAWAVEDLGSGARFVVQGDRFVIGGTGRADLRLDGGGDAEATLIFHPNGEVWLGEDEQDGPLEEGEVFVVAGRRFRLVALTGVHEPTSTAEAVSRYPYEVEARLDGPTGPEAIVRDRATGREHHVSADNRAVLLYLLARGFQADQGSPPDRRGWLSDAEVAVGIWGRRSVEGDPNRLHVLVYRLRRELKAAGFDPWFIEKRRRYIRARLAAARLA